MSYHIAYAPIPSVEELMSYSSPSYGRFSDNPRGKPFIVLPIHGTVELYNPNWHGPVRSPLDTHLYPERHTDIPIPGTREEYVSLHNRFYREAVVRERIPGRYFFSMDGKIDIIRKVYPLTDELREKLGWSEAFPDNPRIDYSTLKRFTI